MAAQLNCRVALLINIIDIIVCKTLKNETISYHKINHNIFEVLAILGVFSSNFHQFICNMKKKKIYLLQYILIDLKSSHTDIEIVIFLEKKIRN